MAALLPTSPRDRSAEPPPSSETELEERLSRPAPAVVGALSQIPGDVIVLGAGGKMGPSLAWMLHRALDASGASGASGTSGTSGTSGASWAGGAGGAGGQDRGEVIAVSRFSAPDSESWFRARGIRTIACDLADPAAVAGLPDAPNVIFMAGQKFGTTTDPAATWGANVVIPAIVAERFRDARMVAFSTGNVYPLTPADGRGSSESDTLDPVGEYARSCVGRERVFDYHSGRHGTPLAIIRLSYAVDLRYGVLVDIAQRVRDGEPVDLAMGYVNAIWQGDANARAIRALAHAASPPFVLNVTGPERLSVRELATHMGEYLGRPPRFAGTESSHALLSDATRSTGLFGEPMIPVQTLVRWVAAWLKSGGRTLGKPTHFETLDGRF
ncbi:MAG: NAD-dependent epimerase/dehydratase family protein [Gemmatimonadaceae bacterium]